MAVTGSGTQADPFIVHSYDEFMSLMDAVKTNDDTYIQFFENPNQVIDCNVYGSEFKWHPQRNQTSYLEVFCRFCGLF